MTSFLNRFIRSTKATFIPQVKGDIRIKCANAIEYYGNEKEDYSEQTLSEKDILDENNIVNEEQRNLDTTSEDSENHSSLKSFFKSLNPITQFKKGRATVHEVHELEKDENFVVTPLDTFIGVAVTITGSIWAFVFAMLLLIAWIIWGACTGAPDTWQIVMQDGQSIQTYVWDTFLMRQQLDDNEKFLIYIGKLKSRTLTHKKLLEKIKCNQRSKLNEFNDTDTDSNDKDFNMDDYVKYEKINAFEKVSNVVAKIVGSLPAVIIYWLGIFAWIGCGALELNQGTVDEPDFKKFSDTWQMYINTATAIELLFTSVFLENVRARTNSYIMRQIDVFNKFDARLEYDERMLVNYQSENDLVEVKRVHRDKIQKCISWYAIVIGNGLGLIISVCVFVAWAAIGTVMDWNDNWWLIIGTYTGLVGFIDGFVLREVFFSVTNDEMNKFDDLLRDAQELLDIAGIHEEIKIRDRKKGFTVKVSLWVNKVCSNEWSVLFSIAVVIGLVVMASALLWSETAQLVCNTPTMIIEGFFLLILIQAQHWASDDRIDILTQLTKSRVLLTRYIEKIDSFDTDVIELEPADGEKLTDIDADEDGSNEEFAVDHVI